MFVRTFRFMSGRARAILIAASSDLRSWRFFMLLAQALTQFRHGLQGYSIGLCFFAPNAKRKEKKEVLGTSSNESKVTYRKILLPVQRPDGTSTKGLCVSVCFPPPSRVSSATFDKLLVLLGPSLTLQDTRMRKSVSLQELLVVVRTLYRRNADRFI